jgi:hypothetical protein
VEVTLSLFSSSRAHHDALHGTRHTSHVTRHTSHVIRLGKAERVKEDFSRSWCMRSSAEHEQSLELGERQCCGGGWKMRLECFVLNTADVTRHTSHLTRHTSHLTPHHLTPHTSQLCLTHTRQRVCFRNEPRQQRRRRPAAVFNLWR